MPRSKRNKKDWPGPARPPQGIEKQLVDRRRRGFLTGAFTASVAVGATSLLSPDASEAEASADGGDRSPSYRETDHIREAYRRMRF